LLFSSARPLLCSDYYDARQGRSNSCRLSRVLLQNREITTDHHITRLCPHGLLDALEPLIVDGERIGAVLIGQVFSEAPDLHRYRDEAQKSGFDVEAFLTAVQNVAIVSRDRFENAVALMSGLTTLLAEQALLRLKAEQNEEAVKLHAFGSGDIVRASKEYLPVCENHPPVNIGVRHENDSYDRTALHYAAIPCHSSISQQREL